MGKRSDFERVERDFYPTPIEAVRPLIPHLPEKGAFTEPCAGDGRLIGWLANDYFRCVSSYDIAPMAEDIGKQDALTFKPKFVGNCFITNPPWDRKILHPLIEHLTTMAPCWLLFDADWAHTKQSAQYMPWLAKIVSVGRVKWIEDSKMTGKDNCAWYLFDRNHVGPTEFYGRT